MTERKRNNLSIYNEVADQWWSDDIRWVRTLKNLVPARLSWFDRFVDWKDKSVLDLGCAGGFMSEAMAGKGAIVSGMDPATEAIEAARTRANLMGQDIKYTTGIGEELPYKDGEFDTVVCVDVLEHVSDLTKVVAEITRVLRPGGFFLYDTINSNLIARLATITIAEDILGLLPRGTHDPAQFIKPAELIKEVKNAGLVSGPQTGLGPRGFNRKGDFLFGPFPLKTVLYMGFAQKPQTAISRGG
ncbi:MAG: 3-demethylubiquinone-9 3-O-methyltransferase [Rhodobacteraceae bacterium]|nr:3-demethylubiquinone-9 3-O-methyltransferase [Paracoccaceae bacterium]